MRKRTLLMETMPTQPTLRPPQMKKRKAQLLKRSGTEQNKGKLSITNNNSLFAVPKMQVEIPSKMSRGITLGDKIVKEFAPAQKESAENQINVNGAPENVKKV